MSLFIPPTFFDTNATLHQGFVANRTRWYVHLENTNKEIMARSGHKSNTAITSLKIAVGNARNSTFNLDNDFNGEVGLGASATVKASIEYPAGTFTQVLFSASATGTIADKDLLISDSVSVSIPANTIFWVRQFWTNPNGVFFNDWQDTFTYGDAVTKTVSGGVDLTMSGTVTDNSGWSFPPAAIIANTFLPSVGIVGDSIGYGAIDDVSPHLGDTGSIAKSLQGKGIPFQNISQCGAGMFVGYAANRYWLTSGTPRKKLLPFCTHVICQLGINDIDGALGTPRTPAQLLSDMTNFKADLVANGLPATARFIQCTIGPHATSSDNFLTAANQTPDSSTTNKATFNNSLRTVVAGINNVIDVGPVLETSTDSGKWGLGLNYITRSNDFPFINTDHWTQTSCTVAQGGFTDPFGTTAAWKFIENSGAGPHFVSENRPIFTSITPPGVWTFSIFAKLGTSSDRRLELRIALANNDFAYVIFDLVNGAFGTQGTGTNSGPNNTITNTSHSITSVGSGWYRCTQTITSTASTIGGAFLVLDNGIGLAPISQTYTGNGTSNVLMFGAQLESGSTATQYLPTATTAPQLTQDGLHPEPTGFSFIVNSNVVHY